MELTVAQIEDIVAFWMLCLPKHINKNIFAENLKRYLSTTKDQRIVLKIDYNPNELLKLLINGGIDKNALYQNANPKSRNLEFSNWPDHGVYTTKIALLIAASDEQIDIYAAVGQGRPYEPLNEQFLQSIRLQQYSQTLKTFHKSVNAWSQLMPSHLARKCFTESDYSKIVILAKLLEKEISSAWPYPNKNRKKIEVKALRSLLNELEQQPYKSLKECVNQVRQEYPGALLGRISPRVRALLNTLVPESSNTINENYNNQNASEKTGLLSERGQLVRNELDLLKQQIIKTFTPCLRHNNIFSLFQTIKPYDRPARDILTAVNTMRRVNVMDLKNILNKTLGDIRKKNYGRNEFLVNLELFIVDCEQIEEMHIKSKKIGTQTLTRVSTK